MRFPEIVVVLAVLVGFAIGRWYEQGRRGGTLDLADHVDALETELETEQLDNAILRGERDQRRASSMSAGIRIGRHPAPGNANVWPAL